MTKQSIMSRRTYAADDSGLGVEIIDAAAEEMLSMCRRAPRLETGGILIGHYRDRHDVAVVVEVLGQPRDSRSGPCWFQRGVAGVEAALQERWRKSPRLYYLGEWHYHPMASAEPSHADLQQMAEIAADRVYRCPEPILAILGGDPHGQSVISVTIVRRRGAHSRLRERS